MNVSDMEAVAERVSELMKSLSHKHRLLTCVSWSTARRRSANWRRRSI